MLQSLMDRGVASIIIPYFMMLMLNYITPLNTLWKPGSDITVVRFDSASRVVLTGEEVTLSITEIGRVTEWLRSRKQQYIRCMGSRTLCRYCFYYCQSFLFHYVLYASGIQIKDMMRTRKND